MPAKKLSTHEVAEIIRTKNPFILDVRPAAFGKLNNFLKDTVHIPLLVLADNLKNIPKDRKIVITDSGAKQAQLACKFLLKNGYQVQGILRGGLEVWVSEGREATERSAQKIGSELKGDDLE
ncbi:MAG: rhodanese-like domain-containing protein [Thermodesulfobacteriota bacterium]